MQNKVVFFLKKRTLTFIEKHTNFANLSWKLFMLSNFTMLSSTKSYNGIPLLQTNDLAQKERCERKNFFSFRAKTVCFYSAAFGVNQLWSTWIMPYSYGITTLLWLIKFELPNWWNKGTTSNLKSIMKNSLLITCILVLRKKMCCIKLALVGLF